MRPRIIATFGWWCEPEWLVEDLKDNLSWADGFAVVDDRDRTGGWGHEGEYRLRQRAAAQAAGADWVLVTSPDERLERDAESLIRAAVESAPADVVFRFRLMEMWTPQAYRVDGKYLRRFRTRLYPLQEGQRMSYKPIHCPPMPIHPQYRKVTLDVRTYDLKMINPANRKARARAYNEADRKNGVVRHHQWRKIGDDRGLKLQQIEPGREFSPPYLRQYRFRTK